MEAVTFINCFEVPSGRDDEFVALWRQINQYMRAKPGYIGTRLHRSASPDARYRFVNVAQWASAEHFKAAHDDGFRQILTEATWKDFRTTSALYQVFEENRTA